MYNQLCWFRNDLRVRDNPAFSSALETGPTYAIYIATPGQWQLHDDAPIKIDFWRRNLIELKRELQKLDVDLLIFEVASYKQIPELINKVLQQLNIAQLHYNREYPLNERMRDQLVDSECSKLKVSISSFDDLLLGPPQFVLNKSGSPFKVFTPFARKALIEIQNSSNLLNTPIRIEKNRELPPMPSRLEDQVEITSINWPEAKSQWELHWPAGESAACDRLEAFIQNQISAYKEQRDKPSVNATSQLSAYLTAGVISAADCWRAAQKYFDNTGVETWQNELLWREFYRYTVVHFPHVCMHKSYRENTDHIPWRHNKEEFEMWCQGQTGYPLVDAGMRQLLSKGWMHNRVRMVTAMFLSKHLLIDWRWGERWFMQNLIDGDFASNNGGWQWSASTGVDAAPYFRIFNPVTQSKRFDAAGNYIRSYIPELAQLSDSCIHEPGDRRPTNYPSPLVDHKFGRARALSAFKDSAS
ncbi:MAG: cryptochrome/photolyase family protein [Pseudohongiellaceae bacterium]